MENVKKENKFKTYYKSLNKNQKIAFYIVLVLAVMLIATCLILLIGEIGTQININYAKNLEFVGSQYTPTCDENNYWTFQLDASDEDFKVLQVTDLHFGGGCFSLSKDRNAIDSIYSLVRYNKPDMIAITGDMVYSFCFSSGTQDNGKATKIAIALFDAIGIPYAPVLGNHDAENLMFKDRHEIGELWESGKYSLFRFQSGDGEDVYGECNYVVNVKRADDSLHSSYIFMDTNSYIKDSAIGLGDYDGVHEDQTQWYKQEVDKLGGAKSFLFMHIPLPEYVDAWDSYLNGNPETKYYFGYRAEKSCPSANNTNLFDVIKEKGSTIGVFCGHDHVNNFSVEYQGIRLTYGLSIDFLAYIGIKNSNFQRGCTILTSYGEDNFDISQCVLAGIAGYKKNYKIY